jgi:hypothetical protein
MRTTKFRGGPILVLLASQVLTGCERTPASAEGADATRLAASQGIETRAIPVSGTAIHYFSTAIVHSQHTQEPIMVQRSTDVIRLDGDLDGFILYHPTSRFDFGAGTLVNTGTQIFSGTVAGSDPVILHDDTFRFEVDLATGATVGEVRLGQSRDAPHPGGWFECRLDVIGTGVTPEGDNVSDYSGECIQRGNQR